MPGISSKTIETLAGSEALRGLLGASAQLQRLNLGACHSVVDDRTVVALCDGACPLLTSLSLNARPPRPFLPDFPVLAPACLRCVECARCVFTYTVRAARVFFNTASALRLGHCRDSPRI